MRTRQALKNALTSMLLQLATAISGIIVPRFFTAAYGSSVNGLVSSIGQFITYMGLVEAGVSAASIVALYRPLAEKDQAGINGIISAAKRFYLRSGTIFVILDAILITAYPFIVKNEITDVTFIRLMILILSLSGIVDYFILGKYRVLLTADQKNYIISLVQIAGIVILTAASVILIKAGASALTVKAAAAAVYVLRCLAIVLYVKKNYPELDLNAEPAKEAVNQKGAALLHQVVGMICNNTDMILLTLLLAADALAMVSVYSVYALVGFALINLFLALSNGVCASFGQVMSVGDRDALKRSFGVYELFCFILVFAAYACMAVLLYPFIKLYSADFEDAGRYISWGLVGLFTACGLVQSIRIPGLTMIMAAGHYRQTRSRAVAEAVINLGVSLALIFRFGIYGVVFGTCVSYLYRSTDTILYNAKYFLNGTLKRTFIRLLRNLVTAAVLVYLGIRFVPRDMSGWGSWIITAVICTLICTAAVTAVNMISEPGEFKGLIRQLKQMAGAGRREKA